MTQHDTHWVAVMMLTFSNPEHVNDLVKKVQEIEGLIKSVVALTEGAKVITCAPIAVVLLMLSWCCSECPGQCC